MIDPDDLPTPSTPRPAVVVATVAACLVPISLFFAVGSGDSAAVIVGFAALGVAGWAILAANRPGPDPIDVELAKLLAEETHRADPSI